MANRPAPEVDLTLGLVRMLVAQQHAELSDLELGLLSRGWDNTNFRLGDHHLVRLPHRRASVPLIEHEQRWLPVLQDRLDVAIPCPTHIGAPSSAFEWPWSITPWFDGTEAARAELDDPLQTAELLGNFFSQLHRPAPQDAPENPYRGCPLSDRRDSFFDNLAQAQPQHLEPSLASRSAQLFDAACDLGTPAEQVWLHGDLHTRNIVINNGQVSAIIDWGDLCAGDRAADLAAAFMLVPNHVDRVAQKAGASEAAWDRATGWALHFAMTYLAHSDDDPVMAGIGHRLVATVLGTESTSRLMW